jgi:hypothetical protein
MADTKKTTPVQPASKTPEVTYAQPQQVGEVPKVDRAPTQVEGLTQVLVPANMLQRGQPGPTPLPIAPANAEYVAAQFEYLEDNGWENMGCNELGLARWRDPVASDDTRGVRQQVRVAGTKDGMLPKQGGGSEPLYQTVVPPVRFDLTTEQAVTIQRRRDVVGKSDGSLTPSERADRFAGRVGKILGDNALAAKELRSLIRGPVPEKPDNMKAELMRLRRGIQDAANKISPAAVEEPAA